MELNNLKETAKNGKFKSINSNFIKKVLEYISIKENIFIITSLNKYFHSLIINYYCNDDTFSYCLREINRSISTEEFKTSISNHCINLEDNLKQYKEFYNQYIFYRSIYFLSYSLFKDINTLELQKNNIGPDGIILISSLIKNTRNLLNLNISYNNIEDDGCKFLSDTLKRNNSLNILNLDCNRITDKGLVYLSESISTHRYLKTIKFVLNNISNDGVRHLANDLEKNMNINLMVIDFKYNNIIIKDEVSYEYLKKLKISL